MKRMLLALFFVGSVANAEVLGIGINKLGQKMLITDEPCTSSAVKEEMRPKMKKFYSFVTDTKYLGGCWVIYDGDKVFVLYNDGDGQLYNSDSFLSPKKNPSLGKYM